MTTKKETKKKMLAFLLSVVMLAAMLSGCGGSGEKKETTGTSDAAGASGNESSDPVELGCTYMTYGNGNAWDPGIDYSGQRLAWFAVCETLTVVDEDTAEVKPHLASSFEQVDDVTWTFTLRDDINFSNGKKLTAEAAKSALEYVLANIDRVALLADIASIEAEGQTLTITTNQLQAILPNILADPSFIIFDTEGTEDFSQGAIGTGAYIVESLDNEGNAVLVKNENYWQGTPGADKINAKCIADASAATLAIQSGEIDFTNHINVDDLALFEGNDQYEMLEYSGSRTYFLFLNPQFTYTQDEALREALTYAFDREAYLEGVYGGVGVVSPYAFPEWSGFADPEQAAQEDYDAEKAKKILADAGYKDTDGDGFLEKDGEKVVLNITTFNSNNFLTLSEVMQSDLKNIGLDSDIVVSESISADLAAGNYNIGMYGYNVLAMGDSSSYMEALFRTGGTANFTGFSSEKVDSLLDELKGVSDVERRKEITIEIQKEVYAANQHVYLLQPGGCTVIRSGVQNVTKVCVNQTYGFGDYFNLWKVTK